MDDEAVAALNTCNYLFLAEIETDKNGLRVVVRPVGAPEPLLVGGTVISGDTRIDVTRAPRWNWSEKVRRLVAAERVARFG